MNGYGTLAATGTGIAIGGVVLEQSWLIAGAAALVIGGALLVRLTFRRNKGIGDI